MRIHGGGSGRGDFGGRILGGGIWGVRIHGGGGGGSGRGNGGGGKDTCYMHFETAVDS